MLNELFKTVDKFGADFVQRTFKQLADTLTGSNEFNIDFLSLLLTLYVIFWGIGIWAGSAQGSVTEQVFRLFRVFVIYTLATSWGDFQTYIYDASQALPGAIGNALLTSVNAFNDTGNAANLNNVNEVQTALQNFWDTAGKTADAFIQKGIFDPGPWLFGIVLYIAAALLVGFAAFLIILCKVMIWVLLGLAPAFIILYLFSQTTSYVEGWLRTVVNFIVVQVLVYAMLAFFFKITQSTIDIINQNTGDFALVSGHLAVFILLCIIGILLLSQLLAISGAITGALGFGAPTIGRFYGAPGRAFAGANGAATRTINRFGWTTPAQRRGAVLDMSLRNYGAQAMQAKLARR
jgi:type IV secretion system protein VirB6